MSSGNSYWSGPVCASWYAHAELDGTDGVVATLYNGESVCTHNSCWTIMALGDSSIGGWFREPPPGLVQELQGYIAILEAEQSVQQETLDWLVKLRSEQTRRLLPALAYDITMVISAYRRLISESHVSLTRMQSLARSLQVEAPEPPKTEPIT